MNLKFTIFKPRRARLHEISRAVQEKERESFTRAA